MSLIKITSQLGEGYRSWKKNEKEKNGAKQEFFDEATKILSESVEERLVEIATTDSQTVEHIIEQRYPRYHLIDHRPIGEDRYEVIIEENPALQPFSFVNIEDGYVYSRQVIDGSVILDDEAIKKAMPDLYGQITEIPMYDYFANLIYEAGVPHQDIESHLAKHFEHYPPPRGLKPLESLTPEQLAALDDFIYYSKPTVKLGAPRKAKPEELEELE